MTEKLNLGGLPATRQKYTPAFKVECVRQVTTGRYLDALDDGSNNYQSGVMPRQTDGSQYWHISQVHESPGYYRLVQVSSERNLSADTSGGHMARTREFDPGPNQEWFIQLDP